MGPRCNAPALDSHILIWFHQAAGRKRQILVLCRLRAYSSMLVAAHDSERNAREFHLPGLSFVSMPQAASLPRWSAAHGAYAIVCGKNLKENGRSRHTTVGLRWERPVPARVNCSHGVGA